MTRKIALRWLVVCAVLLAATVLRAPAEPATQGHASSASPEFAARITDLSDAEYFPAVQRELRNAEESIVVTMYLFRVFPDSPPTSPPFVLLRDLIAARERGVKVRVILCDPMGSGLTPAIREAGRANEAAGKMLAAGGVDVRYASSTRLLHEKVFIIDGATVILGSHNLTVSALTRNREVSVLIRSEAYAARMRERVATIALRRPGTVPGTTPGTGFGILSPESPLSPKSGSQRTIALPMRFLEDSNLLPRMLGAPDHRAFDVFLLLWRQHMQSGTRRSRGMTVSLDVIAADLGMDETMKRNDYRREISRILKKLRDRYGLIEYDIAHGSDAVVRMARGSLRRPRKGTGVAVPAGYWDYGWSRTLTMKAKVMYLICLAQKARSPKSPWWSLSQLKLARQYTNSSCAFTVNQGLRELESHDILHIARHMPPQGEPYSHRQANTYELQPLLSPEEIEKEWNALEDAYGTENLEPARKFAGKLDRPNSRETADAFLRAIEEFGQEAVERVTDDVAKFAPDNPYRHVGTVINRLKEEEEHTGSSGEDTEE